MGEKLRLLSVIFVLALMQICLPLSTFAKTPLAVIGKNTIKLEVAQTKKQIERGLMFRASLPEDHGMVFLFRPAREVRFWMFNCIMSLDMMFIKDGKIVKISHDVPPCKSHKPEDCPVYPLEGPIEASEVIEVNAGYCQRHGVKEGDGVSFSLPGFSDGSEPDKSRTEKAN